jgi:Ion channel
MWNIIVTITLVGYGDLYPETHIGRFIGLSAAIIGNLLYAVMVVSLTFTTEFSPQQRKAYEMIR